MGEEGEKGVEDKEEVMMLMPLIVNMMDGDDNVNGWALIGFVIDHGVPNTGGTDVVSVYGSVGGTPQAQRGLVGRGGRRG